MVLGGPNKKNTLYDVFEKNSQESSKFVGGGIPKLAIGFKFWILDIGHY